MFYKSLKIFTSLYFVLLKIDFIRLIKNKYSNIFIFIID